MAEKVNNKRSVKELKNSVLKCGKIHEQKSDITSPKIEKDKKKTIKYPRLDKVPNFW